MIASASRMSSFPSTHSITVLQARSGLRCPVIDARLAGFRSVSLSITMAIVLESAVRRLLSRAEHWPNSRKHRARAPTSAVDLRTSAPRYRPCVRRGMMCSPHYDAAISKISGQTIVHACLRRERHVIVKIVTETRRIICRLRAANVRKAMSATDPVMLCSSLTYGPGQWRRQSPRSLRFLLACMSPSPTVAPSMSWRRCSR